MRPDVKAEWDELKQHDVLFLLTVRPPDSNAQHIAQQQGRTRTPAEEHGLVYVRGCEVIEIKDAGVYRVFWGGLWVCEDVFVLTFVYGACFCVYGACWLCVWCTLCTTTKPASCV